MIFSLPLPLESLVSVIIPMFNAQAFIREMLESVLRQSYKNLEIIVVDDGSTDNSAVIVSSYGPKVRYVRQESSRNAAIPRNIGLQLCKGDLITFFDADDVMFPHKIEAQVNFLRRNPHIAIVLTDYINFTASGDRPHTHFETCPNLFSVLQATRTSQDYVLEPEQARSFLTKENFFITNSPLLRKELIQTVGMFDEKMTPSEDFELIYRIAMTHQIGILNCVGFRRRLHENNTTRDRKRVLTGLINSRKKLLRLETSPQLQRQLQAFIADRHYNLCEYYIGVNNKLAFLNLLRGQYLSFRDSLRPIRLLLKMLLSMMKASLPGKQIAERNR